MRHLFWLTFFWAFFLEFLSSIIVAANWGAVFNLEFPSWLLLDVKLRILFLDGTLSILFFLFFSLSCENGVFGYCLVWKTFQCRVFRRLSISFWKFDKFITFSLFICYFYLVLVVAKKIFFIERLFLFLERCVHSKNKKLLLPDISLNRFLIKPVLKLLEPTRSIK